MSEVVLQDSDEEHLTAMAHVLRQQAEGIADPPSVTTTTELDRAVSGADFVFSAIRVGGLGARVQDERVALDLGLLGQETTGPGGLSFALRTAPVARALAETVAAEAPDAWVINFTNPAGLITETMRESLGDKVIGICDTPITMAKRAAAVLGVPAARLGDLELDYAGLNHLGWLTGLRLDGADLLGPLLRDGALAAQTEEGQLFGVDWLRTIAALPNEYVYYYDFTREALAAIRAAGTTRGEFLLAQQSAFYAAVAADPAAAWQHWRRTRQEREDTYMSAEHQGAHAGARPGADEGVVDVGGYEGVALAIMRAISRGEPATVVVNVRNSLPVSGEPGEARTRAVPGLPADAVVEVPCRVDAHGLTPLPVSAPTPARLGLMQQVKAVERMIIEASHTGSVSLAHKAFAAHPLVDSAAVAAELVAGYRARIPEVAAVLTAP